MSAEGATAAQVANLCNLTERRVQQLAKEGVIPRASRGRYPLVASVRAYVRYLQQLAEGRPRDPEKVGNTHVLLEERAKKTAAEAEIAVLQLAKLRGEQAPIADMDRAVERLATAVRAEVLGLRSRFTGRIVGLTTPAEAAAVLDAMQAQILAALEARAEAMASEDEPDDAEAAA